MPTIYMQTETVQALAQRILEVSQTLKDQMRSLSSSAYGIDWVGDNRDQFIEELNVLVTWANRQVEAGEFLAQRVEREVQEWEDVSLRLGGDYLNIAQIVGAIKLNPGFRMPGWLGPPPIGGSGGVAEQMPYIIDSESSGPVQIGQVPVASDKAGDGSAGRITGGVIDEVTSRLWDTAKALLSTLEFVSKNKMLEPVTFAVSTVDFFLVKMPEAESAFRAWEEYNRRTDGFDLATARRLEDEARVQLEGLGLSGVMDAFGTITKTLGDHKIIGEAVAKFKDAAYLAIDWLAALGPKK